MITDKQLHQLLALACEAAERAGQYIQNFDRDAIEVDNKEGGSSLASQVVTQVDLACEKMIFDTLKPTCEQFNIAFLGEESASKYPVEKHPRLSRPYFWCVDPLDGTLPFVENTPGYAVSIALLSQDGSPLLGAVYDPVSKTLYQGIVQQELHGIEAILRKNAKPWHPVNRACAKALTVCFDRSFLNDPKYNQTIELMEKVAQKLGYDSILVISQLGAVMNAIQVLDNSPCCYFKLPKVNPGGGSLWDFAATSALAKAAGAWVTDIYGKPLELNSSDSLYMYRKGILFASDKTMADELIVTMAKLTDD